VLEIYAVQTEPEPERSHMNPQQTSGQDAAHEYHGRILFHVFLDELEYIFHSFF
jgi:hypothetical protein